MSRPLASEALGKWSVRDVLAGNQLMGIIKRSVYVFRFKIRVWVFEFRLRKKV
jgi:hypothetical protein